MNPEAIRSNVLIIPKLRVRESLGKVTGKYLYSFGFLQNRDTGVKRPLSGAEQYEGMKECFWIGAINGNKA